MIALRGCQCALGHNALRDTPPSLMVVECGPIRGTFVRITASKTYNAAQDRCESATSDLCVGGEWLSATATSHQSQTCCSTRRGCQTTSNQRPTSTQKNA